MQNTLAAFRSVLRKTGDYLARTGTIVFGVNKTKLTRGIKIYGDNDVENDEVLSVVISNAVFATIDDDTGVITVIDND